MRNAVVLFLLCLALVGEYVLARIYGGFGPWFLLGASASMVLYEVIAVFALRRRYTAVRKFSATRVPAGGEVEVGLEIRIARVGWMPLHWLRVEDLLPPRLAVRRESPWTLVHPWRDQTATATYSLKGVTRGAYHLTGLYVTSGDAFGLLTRRTFVAVEGHLHVYPQTCQIGRWSAAERARLGTRVSHSRTSDDAARVIGVREYIQGDRLSRIHWPATARTGALRSKEFEHYVMNEVVLILDSTRAAFGHDEIAFELALSITGSFVEWMHRQDLAYGLQVLGRPYVALPVGKGDLTLVRAMEYLAVAQPTGEEAFEDALWRLSILPIQTTALVVTRSLGAEWLRFGVYARERQLRVELFLSRPSDPRLSPQEDEIVGRLQALGWRVRVLQDLQALRQLETGWVQSASRA